MQTMTDAGAAPLKLFIPITKIDTEKRLVYGVATAEQLDRSGEICDYDTTKPYYKSWSDEIAKNTGGKSYGNLRSMHQKIAAGKVTDLNFDDDAKKISICAKVVDNAEWEKCLEGVYSGFSQGGRYVKRWDDAATGHTRYTADPTEISLVDLPCLPSATFNVIKADGLAETKSFKTVVADPSAKDVMDRAYELAKAAGTEDPTDAQLDEAKRALLADALAKADAALSVVETTEVEKAGPSDRDIEERAITIAATDGDTAITDEHRAHAREQLTTQAPEPIQNVDSDSVRSIEVSQGNPASGATMMTAEDGITLKATEVEEPVQVWKIGDETFPTKKDALKAVKDRKAAKAIAEVTAPVDSVIDELNRALGIEKKDYSAEERKKMTDKGEAMAGGKYPIKSKADVENAVKDWNRTGQAADVKAHILARAKDLGCTDCVPDDWTSKAAESDDLTKEDVNHDDRMAQHKAMTAFHAAQDGPGQMAAAAAHADAYNAHSAGSDGAEDKTKKAFQCSRDCMGAACKDAPEGDLLKTAGFVVKDAAPPPADKAGMHAAMANFHAKMAADQGANMDAHREAAGAHATAHIAHATGADDADAKSDEAFKCTMKCMGPMKSLEAFALFGAPIAKADEAGVADALRAARKMIFDRLGKGLPTCARLADLIEELKWVLTAVAMEARQENDNSPLPMKLKADLQSLCDTLNAMTAEETRELIEGQNVDDLYQAESMSPSPFYAAARIGSLVKFMQADKGLAKAGLALSEASAGELDTSIAALAAAVEARAELAKAGRRNSASDTARIQKVHDLATDLGADCNSATGKSAHGSEGETMEKLEAITEENANLKAKLADYGQQLTNVLEDVKKLKASPAPAKAALFAVSKDTDAARANGSPASLTDEQLANKLASMSQEELNKLLMKGALARPVRHIER